jgi:hypothetical protein
MRETVPDSVLDLADEVVLVDLTPEQLRARLAEGKVYLGDRAATASENFFRAHNRCRRHRHLFGDLRSHRLLGSRALLSPHRHARRHPAAALAHAFSRRA